MISVCVSLPSWGGNWPCYRGSTPGQFRDYRWEIWCVGGCMHWWVSSLCSKHHNHDWYQCCVVLHVFDHIIPLIHTQRAERSDAVRKHVRSRISEQNLQDQTDPVPANTFPNPALPPLSLGSPARTAPGSALPLGPAGGLSACIRN